MKRFVHVEKHLSWIALAVVMSIGSARGEETAASLYAKKDTWTETMLAARAKLLESLDPMPEIWKGIQADFPTQAGWLTQDAGRGRELQWLSESPGTGQIHGLIQRVLRQVGPQGADLKKQLDALRQAKTSADDARWLDLYARACRYRECSVPLGKIWIVDLREYLDAEFARLIGPGVSPDDPRWDQLKTSVTVTAEKLGSARPLDMSAMQRAVESLAAALPGRFAGADLVAAELAKHQQASAEVLAAVAKGDPDALERLPAVAERIQDSHRSLLLAMRGMREFLAAPAHAEMESEWADQFASLQHDLRNRGHFAKVGPEAHRPEALILESDRDPADVVLRRTEALLVDLQVGRNPPELGGLPQELAELRAANAKIDLDNAEARYVLFADACRVRRQIALSNPLLDFDEIVFIKRHRALFNHMCDQYYGMAATPGGGLYVLADAFGANPTLRDVLADATVENGRLKGTRLDGGSTTPPAWRFDGSGNVHGEPHEGGSFLSPDLSYDGRRVVFAYVECRGDQRHRHHVDPTQGHWEEGRCFHLFSVNVDGTDLRQLTDGTWNDFDPCWLPNGRIAFITERRGGYLRCGRVCPTYTLFDMTDDGGDVNCLSFHETNEWHPSVTNDGQIIWTRWDYVDRHGCTAHMPWLTTLDGCNPRAVHGNFAPRNSRPDMETDCRAIPGSHKFVAMASPHHGQSYGSMILIDPRIPDDDGMAPVRRITPEVGFPESQGGAQVYGTPWALSEDYYLCVYDSSMQSGGGRQGGSFIPGNYGIYLVDAFGNKELLYRDREIACLSPTPLRARPMPAAAPQMVEHGPETNPATRSADSSGDPPREGTVAVVNVYNSIKEWPEGSQIKELRVFQILPMSVPSGGPPHETALRVKSAGDSVVPTRFMLGTVPVEEDGSVHFTVPANKEIFFQVLDEDGLAVQSMRSATHVREGERMVCVGCHEPKPRATAPMKNVPLAFRRDPSKLKPGVDGTNPFSYPRLVQPVLDRNCVECHTKHSDKAPNLGREPMVRNWYASYNSLVHEYGFHNYGDSYRTTPGRFGAKASKLYELLQKGHHDVKLSKEDMRRITLWLDSTSMFYGVYEREGGQAQLRGEVVRPTLE